MTKDNNEVSNKLRNKIETDSNTIKMLHAKIEEQAKAMQQLQDKIEEETKTKSKLSKKNKSLSNSKNSIFVLINLVQMTSYLVYIKPLWFIDQQILNYI